MVSWNLIELVCPQMFIPKCLEAGAGPHMKHEGAFLKKDFPINGKVGDVVYSKKINSKIFVAEEDNS